jgi:hypothetical protein
MAPVFDLPPPEDDAVDDDEDVGRFEAEVVEVRKLEVELEAPINAPGSISGLSKEDRCEDNGEIRWRGEFLPPADLDAVSFQLFSSWHVMLVHFGKYIWKRTVMSRVAQWGTRISEGTSLGNL